MIQTTWNTICKAVQTNNHCKLSRAKKDFSVVIYSMLEYPGWLEVCRPDGKTIFFLPVEVIPYIV